LGIWGCCDKVHPTIWFGTLS